MNLLSTYSECCEDIINKIEAILLLFVANGINIEMVKDKSKVIDNIQDITMFTHLTLISLVSKFTVIKDKEELNKVTSKIIDGLNILYTISAPVFGVDKDEIKNKSEILKLMSEFNNIEQVTKELLKSK